MSTAGTHGLIIGAAPLHVVSPFPQHASNEHVGNPSSSEGLYILSAPYSWDGMWELRSDLLVNVRTTWQEVLATTYLSVQEQGVGESFEAAVMDLLTSLSDYYQSLLGRETNLGTPGIDDLKRLRSLIKPKSAP